MDILNPLKSYTQIAAQTAPPGQLILMLFDRALRSLDTAIAGFEYSDPRERNEAVHNNLRRAIDIIRFLNNSLNVEEGGELAGTLRRLYFYCESRLINSNLKKHRDGVHEVVGHIKPLRDAWAEMLSRQGCEQPDEMAVA